MRYRLRTLLIVLAILPPLLAWGWLAWQEHAIESKRQAERAKMKRILEEYSNQVAGGGWQLLYAPPENLASLSAASSKEP